MNRKSEKYENGIKAMQMDLGSAEYEDFRGGLLKRSEARTEEQKIKIELLALKYKIEEYLEKEDCRIMLAGEFIRQYLDVLKIKQNRFAEYIGMKPSNLSKLLKGERPINYRLALILGRLFDVNPIYWLEIQTKNEFMRLKGKSDDDIKKYSLRDLLKMKGFDTEFRHM